MTLVNMKELLVKADNENYAVGSFSVANLEMILGAIKAAEELRSPIILQIAEVRLKHSPLEIIGPAMIKAAENAKVPVAVHFDHGLTVDNIKKALNLGFTSVMIDGSSLDLLENIKITTLVESLARDYGAAVEGEIGHVGGSEDGSENKIIKVTDLEDAKKFISDTNIDALAVAIGNSHGVYKGKPKLRFDVLTELNDNLNIPLVLHGGSGIYEDDFRKCATMGIRKINIATATFNKVKDSVKDLNERSKDYDYFTLHETEIEGAYENVKKHIKVFGSDYKV